MTRGQRQKPPWWLRGGVKGDSVVQMWDAGAQDRALRWQSVGGGVVDEGIPGLADRLDYLFKTVINPKTSRLYSNDAVAAALAEKGVSVTGTHISHLRTGRRDNPSARLLAGLAQLFGVPIGYFFDPRMEERINAELGALGALRDTEARSLMMRAQGISPESMKHLKGILERIREIEGLD